MQETCQICDQAPTVDSHLMPQAIGRDIRGDGKSFLIGSLAANGKLVTQNGVFDRFLCEAHEKALHAYENYAISFIRSFELTLDEKRQQSFFRQNTNNEAIVRFVSSILWRYHTSTRPETASVRLGGWEPILRDVTFGGDLAKAPDILVLGYHSEALPSNRFAIPPSTNKFEDRRVWTFVTNGLAFMAKLDQRSWSASSSSAVINGRDYIAGAVKEMSRDDLMDMKLIVDRMKAGGKMRF